MLNTNTKQAILDAAIELIREKSIDKISIRDIATKAGTNSAGISYYFGSRENLISESMKFYWTQLCDIYEKVLNDAELTPEKTRVYCKKIMHFYLNSKGILVSEQVNFGNRGIDTDTSNRISMQLGAINYIIKSLKPEVADKDIPVKAIRFISSLAHPALWAENYKKVAPQGISFEEFLEEYIKDLVENI